MSCDWRIGERFGHKDLGASMALQRLASGFYFRRNLLDVSMILGVPCLRLRTLFGAVGKEAQRIPKLILVVPYLKGVLFSTGIRHFEGNQKGHQTFIWVPLLWMDEVVHHLKTMVETIVGVHREIRITAAGFGGAK